MFHREDGSTCVNGTWRPPCHSAKQSAVIDVVCFEDDTQLDLADDEHGCWARPILFENALTKRVHPSSSPWSKAFSKGEVGERRLAKSATRAVFAEARWHVG